MCKVAYNANRCISGTNTQLSKPFQHFELYQYKTLNCKVFYKERPQLMLEISLTSHLKRLYSFNLDFIVYNFIISNLL